MTGLNALSKPPLYMLQGCANECESYVCAPLETPLFRLSTIYSQHMFDEALVKPLNFCVPVRNTLCRSSLNCL